MAQIKTNGVWKTRSAAFPMLLKSFHDLTGTPVSLELTETSLDDKAIFNTPFLYLTGSTDFTLTDSERANLRRFLDNGGMLFAEAGEGRQTFDAAFRAEMQKVLPNHPLAPFAPDSELLNQLVKAETVKARSCFCRSEKQSDRRPRRTLRHRTQRLIRGDLFTQ